MAARPSGVHCPRQCGGLKVTSGGLESETNRVLNCNFGCRMAAAVFSQTCPPVKNNADRGKIKQSGREKGAHLERQI